MTENRPNQHINPALISRYLLARGWRSAELRHGLKKFSIKDADEDATFELIINSSDPSDRRNTIFAINTLSDYYSISREIVYRQIIGIGSDSIMSRVPDEYVTNESIKLALANSYMKHMREVLVSSASTEISGQRHFRRALKDGVAYADGCRFGHTFQGSFGFKIESPLPVNDQPAFNEIEENTPFERRVVERIYTSLEQLSTASERSDPNILSQDGSPLSSNMCDDIADLVEEMGVSKMSIDFALSPEWRPKTKQTRTSYTIQAKDTEILRNAAKSLRADETPEEVKIVARIQGLHTEGNPSDLLKDKSPRKIILHWTTEDRRNINVHLNLAPDDYLEAVEAHKEGRFIAVRGLLQREGRSWSLFDIREFEVLEA